VKGVFGMASRQARYLPCFIAQAKHISYSHKPWISVGVSGCRRGYRDNNLNEGSWRSWLNRKGALAQWTTKLEGSPLHGFSCLIVVQTPLAMSLGEQKSARTT
jgi:hypothetical protein